MNTKIPAPFLTNVGKLKKGYWPWTKGIRSRFPFHYKQRFAAKFMTPMKPVHYRPDTRKFTFDEFGKRTDIVNIPIPVIYPMECNEGLWGGEGIVKGFTKKKNKDFKPRSPRVWIPNLMKRVFRSQVLDRWLEIVVTDTTLDAIDDCFGFDHYILSTSEQDLRSKLGMRLKREMLLKLCSLQSNDELLRDYGKYVIPREEAEWIGLCLAEAEDKMNEIEKSEIKLTPHKHDLYDEFVSKIGELSMEEVNDTKSSDWKSKLSPFK